jgi:hypothetical protein
MVDTVPPQAGLVCQNGDSEALSFISRNDSGVNEVEYPFFAQKHSIFAFTPFHPSRLSLKGAIPIFLMPAVSLLKIGNAKRAERGFTPSTFGVVEFH